MEGDDDVRSRFLSGDPAGLDAAYRRYGKTLFAVARRILGEDVALDCVHDVLLRIWRRPQAYRAERGSLHAFLHVSVRNEAIGRARASTRHLEIERRAAAAESPSYGFEIEDHVTHGALREALSTLPAEQLRALGLAYFGELTHVQIAERTGEPLGTIKGRLGLAMRKLQRALADPEGAR